MTTVSLIQFQSNSSPQKANQALKLALKTKAQAQHCAVVWFAEISNNKMYRELGYSSIYQYAKIELGFSSTRTGDFLRLARKFEELPQLKNELAKKVNTAQKAAKVSRDQNPNQGSLVAAPPAKIPTAAIKHRLTFELSTEQLARYEALWEKLHKHGGIPAGNEKTELLLAGMASLLEATGSQAKTQPTAAVQIHVHQCPDCEQAAITTNRGEACLAPNELARLQCDAKIGEPGQPNRATIAPAIRREVLSRDRYQCQSPGCPNTHFLEVHHIIKRSLGGSNLPENLVTLCGACHQMHHDGETPKVAPRGAKSERF